MGAEAEHGVAEDARLRAEGCGRTEGCSADRHERTQAECDLSEQRATNGGQHAREGTDASHDAGQEHETASKAADSSEDRAEHGWVHGIDELQRIVHGVKDRHSERLDRLGEVDEQLSEVLEQVTHARQDIPCRLEEVEQCVIADERVGPVGPSLAGVDQPVGELLGKRPERIDEVPQSLDRVLHPDAHGGRVLFGIAANASKPLGRLVRREPLCPHVRDVGEVLTSILEERGERLRVAAHDHLDG